MQHTLQASRPEPLIVFGAALYPNGKPTPALVARVQAALVYGATRPVTYIVTGGVAQNGLTEAAVMAHLLARAGVPAQQIIMEHNATDTFDSIVLCSHILTRLGVTGHTPIAMVTSPLHTPRCVLLLRMADWRVHSLQLAHTAHSSIPLRVKLRGIAHECLAIPWDALLVLVWRIVPR
ncbi:YdcF family protein [Acetobacter lambici]|uniref:YdcF family protein n=1 Tax=Acetobacter lambici TaxID=1332824 RepID=A0ABT1EVR5_9PROT|nr:YdcF family protein [Acetobacter lambici]MCP1241284.1 YdcF family protein [Acetobacter lambici]MCP1257046.1 YdcF family protein [Acetobacter lambici]NHO55539.1 YdcF family protein [Acetobacter lambici]